MKIAFISQSLDNVLPPQQSSIGIWSYQVAQRLAKTHQVSIYLKHARDLPSLPAESKIKYRLIKAMPNQLLLNLAQRYARISNPQKPLYAHVAYNLEYSLQIARDLAKQNYDIVHIQNFSQFVPIIRQFNPNTKIILHMHCEWLSQLDRHMIEKRLLQTDLIMGCSHYIVNKIKAQFPQFADKCCTIFNGVDVEQFTPILEQTSSPGNDYPRLLFVGRLSPEKGIHILLEA
jgi:glycosyltransferase involved in cell wall biosynthesis